MKNKQAVFLTTLLLLGVCLSSCSFKSDDSEASQVSGTQAVQFDPKEDSDGDQILNGKEEELGLDPYVADIPKLQSSFLQNYKIQFSYIMTELNQEITESIDTRVGRNDPNFKYRVGSILVKDQSLKEAARIGQFYGHTWGDIQERDLSWIKYPEVDPKFYQYHQVNYGNVFTGDNVEITSLSIEIENSIRLKTHPLFSSITDLELNFYYYSHELESWQLIGSKLVDRVFAREQTETFSVTLENVPLELIRDSYLKRGEFIVSEIKDFKINGTGQTYKTLMESVKAKTVQVILNTPHEIEQNFVAAVGDARVSTLLSYLYGENRFRLQDNTLTKLLSFENNLPSYTYLKEIKNLDKKGNWFAFTNRLNQHYLENSFKSGEAIVLSYVTGDKLASQKAESFMSLRQDISGEEDYKIYPLGNITTNSKVNFFLSPRHLRGTGLKTEADTVQSRGGSCGRNCISQEFTCNLSINTFEERDYVFDFKSDFSGELSLITLVINDTEYSLKELVDSKKITASVLNREAHFEIRDVEGIQELNSAEENTISLKIKTVHGTAHSGVKLTAKSGRDHYMCAGVAVNYSGANGLPISVESIDFQNLIEPYTDWSRITRGISREYSSPFEISVSANVTNFYN
jgi:hypothetical protein